MALKNLKKRMPTIGRPAIPKKLLPYLGRGFVGGKISPYYDLAYQVDDAGEFIVDKRKRARLPKGAKRALNPLYSKYDFPLIKKRKPSEYNRFIGTTIKRLKKEMPELTAQERFAEAVAIWNEIPKGQRGKKATKSKKVTKTKKVTKSKKKKATGKGYIGGYYY